MSVKKEIEAAAVATIKCPSCSAEPGKSCHYAGKYLNGEPAFPNSKVPTHQRRLSTFVASSVKEKL